MPNKKSKPKRDRRKPGPAEFLFVVANMLNSHWENIKNDPIGIEKALYRLSIDNKLPQVDKDLAAKILTPTSEFFQVRNSVAKNGDSVGHEVVAELKNLSSHERNKALAKIVQAAVNMQNGVTAQADKILTGSKISKEQADQAARDLQSILTGTYPTT